MIYDIPYTVFIHELSIDLISSFCHKINIQGLFALIGSTCIPNGPIPGGHFLVYGITPQTEMMSFGFLNFALFLQ
jgi:hypothetical protein